MFPIENNDFVGLYHILGQEFSEIKSCYVEQIISSLIFKYMDAWLHVYVYVHIYVHFSQFMYTHIF